MKQDTGQCEILQFKRNSNRWKCLKALRSQQLLRSKYCNRCKQTKQELTQNKLNHFILWKKNHIKKTEVNHLHSERCEKSVS